MARGLWESGVAADLQAARSMAADPHNWPLAQDPDALPADFLDHPMR